MRKIFKSVYIKITLGVFICIGVILVLSLLFPKSNSFLDSVIEYNFYIFGSISVFVFIASLILKLFKVKIKNEVIFVSITIAFCLLGLAMVMLKKP